jgi:hypothetical protein
VTVDGSAATTFTQQDLNNNKVAYEHTGSTAGTDPFTFDLSDDDGVGPTDQTFTIEIKAGTPTANNDTYIVTENSTFDVGPSGGVGTNDSDPDGDNLTFKDVSFPFSFESDGSFTYIPDDDFSGRDSFEYIAEDPAGNTDTATVDIAVLPAAEQYVTTAGQSLSIPAPDTLLSASNDCPEADTPGEVGAVCVGSAPSNGSVTFNGDRFTYTPGSDFSGTDAFEYEVGAYEKRNEDGELVLGGTVSARISIRVRALQDTVNITRSFPNPTNQESFRLVALPGSTNVSLASTLPGQQGEDWRAFQEDGAIDTTASSRTQCGADVTCSLTSGTGYWLIARNDWSVNQNLQTVSLQPDSGGTVPSVVRIPLQDGWNIISNPLEEDVSWDAVQDASGTEQALFRWQGDWLDNPQTFASAASGEAYYFRDDNLDTLVVPFPGVQRKDASEKTNENTRRKQTAEGQTLTLRAVQDDDTLSVVRAGRHPESKRGLDDTDRYGPPGYFGTSLRLLPPEAERPSALRTEYRPLNGEGSAFDVRLRTSSDSALTLAAQDAAAFEDDQVVLVNRSSGRSHDLKVTPTVTVSPSSTTRFQLLIGSSAFVDDAKQQAVPDEVQLLPNYPNPFRRTTTLEYSLPSAQDVRLVIYDVLGRRVETVVDNRQKAGFHTIQWDGGRSLASGMYFARLVAGSTTKTERLVILR